MSPRKESTSRSYTARHSTGVAGSVFVNGRVGCSSGYRKCLSCARPGLNSQRERDRERQKETQRDRETKTQRHDSSSLESIFIHCVLFVITQITILLPPKESLAVTADTLWQLEKSTSFTRNSAALILGVEDEPLQLWMLLTGST